ncbi:MAG TPA: tRNA (adenosine(37)-N6)-threonylcarbamoyltransferase complex ATPase subunit type 1 TsaE [Verrucomicrobiae bacterium]|nr:tRNA (adenosine(37)-N6)-threonylcarbamoyltransferase complex ATPase subunit type 1 TsaE [Verrucomicrobiae bacterium]
MATHISTNPEQTVALGRAFGERARPGMIVGLKGDLGAGKTQFVRGVAAGLGSTDRVHSPTFALINEYRTGRLPIFHIDLYRLETTEAILSAGLNDFFQQSDGVTLIEWFERLESAGMANLATHLLRFKVTGDNERVITDENPRA